MTVKRIIENIETKKRFYADIDGYIKDENDIYSRIFQPVKITLYRKDTETKFIRIIKTIKYENYNAFEKEWRIIEHVRRFNLKSFQQYLEYQRRKLI